jgi:hypothetical protein
LGKGRPTMRVVLVLFSACRGPARAREFRGVAALLRAISVPRKNAGAPP